MALCFLLNQKHMDLAVAESKAAAHGWGWWQHKEKQDAGILVCDSKAVIKHLGLTKRVIKLLATCAPGNVRSTLEAQDWKALRGKRYKVVLTKQSPGPATEREFAAVIWRSLKDPKVDLENPEVIIDIFLTASTAYIGTRLWENTEDFESRRAHLRPQLHPSSMHPAVSRALVNIACAKVIHDPCCGSGGTIIEAGLGHVKASGGDIEPSMIAMAKENCAAYGLHPELRVADAAAWIPRTGAIVTDLPYGKATSPVALRPLADAILLRAGQSTGRAVIGVPGELVFPWKVRAHLTSYVHKSMTKHFYVIEK
jgi:putative methyltransferase (TIGR01177 family)